MTEPKTTSSSSSSIISTTPEMSFYLNLDQVKAFEVKRGDKTIVISRDEIWKALE